MLIGGLCPWGGGVLHMIHVIERILDVKTKAPQGGFVVWRLLPLLWAEPQVCGRYRYRLTAHQLLRLKR